MKLNADKCHILISGHKNEVMIGRIGNVNILESHKVKLLGIDIDSNLKFEDYIKNICVKAARKLNALLRQCAILPLVRQKIIMNAFFNSQFSYCPLVWMFCSKKLNNKINKLQYRALQITYRDYLSTYKQLLDKEGTLTIH